MSNHKIRWEETRKRRLESQPWIRLDSAELRPAEKGDGYEVIVHGFNLMPRLSPPSFTVGKQRLTRMQFEADGRRVTGWLETEPQEREVVADYGFARDSCSLTY